MPTRSQKPTAISGALKFPVLCTSEPGDPWGGDAGYVGGGVLYAGHAGGGGARRQRLGQGPIVRGGQAESAERKHGQEKSDRSGMREGSEGRAERQHEAGDGECFSHGDRVTPASDEPIGSPARQDRDRTRSGKGHEGEPTRSGQ